MIDWVIVLILSAAYIITFGLLTFWVILELEQRRRLKKYEHFS